MKLRVPTPRLLPVTIGMLAAVFVSKSLTLALDAIALPPIFPPAWAEGHEGHEGAAKHPEPHAKPAEKAAEKPAAAEPPVLKEPPEPPGPPPISESERAVLLELRQRRQDLEARESTLTSRESVLKAAEQKLASRVEELQGLQHRLESLDVARQQQDDAAWKGLVKVYETMKPRDAGAIFNDLDMPVLLSVVGRMKEARAAAILAAMSPDKAREVTTQLALTRTKAADAARNGEAAPSVPPKPGGAGT